MAKLLIVDDSALSRRMLRRILERGGHQVIEADEGLSALEGYYLERPDAVLLDLTMNGMHGLDVLEKLRQADSRAAVIIATADIQSSTQAMAREAGACGFISKPFAPDEVLRTVESVLVGGTEC
jgi:two-component system chemotaxis response regulator CheY